MLFLFLLVLVAGSAISLEPLDAKSFEGLAFRSIGPALMSGRITDIAIHSRKRSMWYVALGSGGVWKTTNSGTTWTPIFDGARAYSIGCITLDPNNPEVVWVGTGENVSGRQSRDRLGIKPEWYVNWMDCLMQAVSEHDPEYSPEVEAGRH
jgi:hypothetical protein